MGQNSIILVGAPDSGKTNFLARLWEAVRSKDGRLVCPTPPANIEFLESILAHLHKGKFAPRSGPGLLDLRKDVILTVRTQGEGIELTEIVVPDVSGELWRKAVENRELPQEWLDELEKANSAILFVRVGSDLNIAPLDWVTAAVLLQHEEDAPADKDKIPTQVALSELLRFLEEKLAKRPDGAKPRVAVVVTAWDRLDSATAARGPMAFLRQEFPLFAGRLLGSVDVEIGVFGLSIVGGDLEADAEFRQAYLRSDTSKAGYVVLSASGTISQVADITMPLAWIMGCDTVHT